MFEEFADEYESELKPAPPKPFQLLEASAFANSFQNEWIIKDILPKGELAVVYGGAGSGKSFMALDIAMSIAQGTDWLRKRVKQGRVVYICAEGAGNFKKRIHAYSLHHGIMLNKLDNLRIIAERPNFLAKTDAHLISETINQWGGCSLIIVDTMAQTMLGGNENSSEDMGHAMQECLKLHAATKAMIMLIHHSGKETSKGARGWSGLRGAADTEIEVRKVGLRGHAGRITKQKDGEDQIEWGFELPRIVLGLDDDRDEISSCYYQPVDYMPLDEKN